MRHVTRIALVAAACLLSASSLHAQPAPNPSGHWEATLQVQGMSLPIEVDLLKNTKGEVTGTFGQPAQSLKGLPLVTAAADGATVTFTLVSGSTFRGTLAADGKSLTGDFRSQTLGTVPVTLTRTADAHIEPPPRNAAIAKELEGVWSGTLDTDGGLRLILKLSNHPDGTSAGTMVAVDQSPIEAPLAIVQKGTNLQLDIRMVGASYTGDLNAAATEIAGTFKTAQGVELPLTFRRQ